MVRSPLSDGQWHRLHPLTPLLRGGLVLLVVIGIVVTNLRDRVIGLFLPGDADWDSPESDTIDYIVGNNLLLVALAVVAGAVALIVCLLWVAWRFHTFRITGDDVEVRSGVLFRTHRRAPLDRVQGVNLVRPMIARLLGMAKLEVVGAGTDGNVKLEYLSTSHAEAVRGDILRLASGRQLAEGIRPDPGTARGVAAGAAATVTEGLSGLIDGVDRDDDLAPESVVNIPVGRLIASHLLSAGTVGLVLMIVAVVVGAVLGTPWVLFSVIPMLIGFGAYWFRQITRTLRYSIAPTAAGVRITFGLFTTTTETIPPGRIHAVAVRQSILWRPMGWWSVRVNRLSGRSVTDTSTAAQQFAEVLPVGTRADVERVLRLILPSLPEDEWHRVFHDGILGPAADDPFTNTPRRAGWLRPLSWRRNGVLITPAALMARKGAIWRSLVILPLARLQSVRLDQGPVDRMMRTAMLMGNTIAGPVVGFVAHLDRDDAVAAWEAAASAAVSAAASDTSHRWSAVRVGGDAAGPDTAAVGAGEVDATGRDGGEASAAVDGGAGTAEPLTRRAARAARTGTGVPEPPAGSEPDAGDPR